MLIFAAFGFVRLDLEEIWENHRRWGREQWIENNSSCTLNLWGLRESVKNLQNFRTAAWGFFYWRRIWFFFEWIDWNVGKFDCRKCFSVVDESWVGSLSSNGGFRIWVLIFRGFWWSLYWNSVIWLASEDGDSVFVIWVSIARGSGISF